MKMMHQFQATEEPGRHADGPMSMAASRYQPGRPRLHHFGLAGLGVGLTYFVLNASPQTLLIAGLGTGLVLGALVGIAVWTQNHSRW